MLMVVAQAPSVMLTVVAQAPYVMVMTPVVMLMVAAQALSVLHSDPAKKLYQQKVRLNASVLTFLNISVLTGVSEDVDVATNTAKDSHHKQQQLMLKVIGCKKNTIYL